MTTPAALMTPPPFPEPELLPARRLMGTVLLANADAGGEGDPTSTTSTSSPAAVTDAHILCIESSPSRPGEQPQGEEPPRYFWLQRKIRTTPHDGAVRVGFVLQKQQAAQQQQGNDDDEHACWTVAGVEEDDDDEQQRSLGRGNKKRAAPDGALPPKRVQMVAIRVEPKARVLLSNQEQGGDEQDRSSYTELAALQWVARHAAAHPFEEQGCEYVKGPSVLLAGDAEHVYIITPYDYYHTGSSSLFEYCATQPGGVVAEETARGFFRQIVKGLEVLQRVQICHRNLSLESVILRHQTRGDASFMVNFDPDASSYCCTLTQLGHAVRVPPSALEANNQAGSVIQIGVQPQPLTAAGRYPQYVAPELWNGGGGASAASAGPASGADNVSVFDGYAADLWSAGVMLLAMLLGHDKLFAAPVPADPIFRRICSTNGLKGYVAKIQKTTFTSTTTPISEDAIDLLQRMLRVDPKERLTLVDVQQHRWVRYDAAS